MTVYNLSKNEISNKLLEVNMIAAIIDTTKKYHDNEQSLTETMRKIERILENLYHYVKLGPVQSSSTTVQPL